VGDGDLSASPALFVVQLASELGPAGIGDRSGQSVVSQHARGVQVFDDEPVVSLDQRVGDLVCEMSAHIGDAVVMPAQSGSGSATVV
jgi:hypothetical protein